MSFRSLLDRRVTITPRRVDGEDDYGNERLVDGDPIADVRAARDLLDASEDEVDRDAQTRRFVYFLPARLDDGTPLALDGYAVLEDVDGRFRIDGEPELVARRRGGRPHHFELVAERTD